MESQADPRNRTVRRVVVGRVSGGAAVAARVETTGGDVLVLDGDTLAALVRGYITVTTQPGRDAVELAAVETPAGVRSRPPGTLVLLEQDTDERSLVLGLETLPAPPSVPSPGLGRPAAAPQGPPRRVTPVPLPPAAPEDFDGPPTSPFGPPAQRGPTPFGVVEPADLGTDPGTSERLVAVERHGIHPSLPVLPTPLAPPEIVAAEPSLTGPVPAVPRVGGPTGPVTSSLPPPPGPRLPIAATPVEQATDHDRNLGSVEEPDDLELGLESDDGPIFGEIPTEGGRAPRR